MVDLDVLAAGYRHRPPSAAALARAERTAAGAAPGAWALDVGGGSGAQAAVWRARGLQALVVDRSPRMLAAAAAGVHRICGDGRSLPVAAGTFGVVVYHLSIHYLEPRRAMAEAARVLRPGGRLWIWTMTPADIARSHLARWFPRVAEIDGRRFPAPEALRAAIAAAGLRLDLEEPEIEHKEIAAGAWTAAAAHRFVSTLQLLSTAELESGLAAFREAHPDPAAVVRYVLRFRVLAATKPALA